MGVAPQMPRPDLRWTGVVTTDAFLRLGTRLAFRWPSWQVLGSDVGGFDRNDCDIRQALSSSSNPDAATSFLTVVILIVLTGRSRRDAPARRSRPLAAHLYFPRLSDVRPGVLVVLLPRCYKHIVRLRFAWAAR